MAERPPALTPSPTSPTDQVERLRQEVADLRDGIGRDVGELESRLRATLDLRRQVTTHPFVAAAIVVCGVLVVGRLATWLLRGGARRGRRQDRRRTRAQVAPVEPSGRS